MMVKRLIGWSGGLWCMFSPAVMAAELFAYSGSVTEEAAYSYQHDDVRWSKLSSTANLQVDGFFSASWTGRLDLQASYDAAYDVEGSRHFTAQTLDQYRHDVRINDFYTDVDVNEWLNLRLGRQYFGWGESNSEQISDIGNPRDLREMGLQHVKDIRLPVGASKLTAYGESWEYNLIAIHEVRTDELGAKGSEFDPYLALRRYGQIVERDQPSAALDNTGLMSRLYLSQDWGDISLFAGRTFAGLPLLTLQSFDSQLQQPVFRPDYFMLTTVGLFGNVTSGSLQLKYELARQLHRRQDAQLNIAALLQEGVIAGTVAAAPRHNVLKSMAGLEYTGLSDTQMSLEYISSYIEGHTEALREPRFSSKISLYWSQTFLNGNLSYALWTNHFVQTNAQLFRLDLTYNYDDAVKYFMALSGVSGAKSATYYDDYQHVDRVGFGVKVSF